MRLFFAETRAEEVIKSVRLGGIHCWSTPELVVPPGKTLTWSAPFKWGDYGSRPGTYRLQWKVGKVTSEPVTYAVVRPGEKTGPASRPAVQPSTSPGERPNVSDPRATERKTEVRKTSPVHHTDDSRPPTSPDDRSYALPVALGVIGLSLAALIGGLAVFRRRRAGK